MTSRARKLAFGLASGGTLALLLLEGLLRLVPTPLTNSYLPRRFDPRLGYVYESGDGWTWASACQVTRGIHVNRSGFRDEEHEPGAGRRRLLLLGDSFVDALQVRDEETIGARLQELTGIETVRLGRSGMSTSYALALYERLGRSYRPDTVLLAFYLGNDVSDDWMAARGAAAWVGYPRVVVAGDGFALHEPRPDHGFLRELARRSYAARLLRWAYWRAYDWRAEVPRVAGTHAPAWKGVKASLQIYRPLSGEWIAAWDNERRLLAELKRRVEADGARLLVIDVPGALEQLPDPRRGAAALLPGQVPEDFDVEAAHARLALLLDDLGIERIDLVPRFRNRPREVRDGTPRYSFPCDGHWNAEGHALAARVVAEHLRAHPLGGSLAAR